MYSKWRTATLSVLAAALLSVSGLALASAQQTVPATGPVWGCVTGSSRTLEHVYTVQSAFQNFLNANNGSCPNGFPVAVGAPSSPSPSPSPTPTATPTPTPTPTSWKCTTSSFTGGCDFADPAVYGSNTTGASSVRNQIWYPQPGETSVMRANGLQDWQDTVNAPSGNTSVTGWPDSQVTLTTGTNTPAPLTGFSSMTSDLTITPQNGPGTSEDLGWDVWGGQSGNSGSDYSFEMMVWSQSINRGKCGDVTVLATGVTFGGNTFSLCRNGPSGPTSEYIWYLSDASGNPVSQASLSIDIYAMLQYMISHGYYPSNYGINQVTVGSEVCSTGGQPETVTLSKWTLAAA